MFRNLKKYSVSYTNLNPNFCISKVKKVGGDISYADKSVVAVVRNILNRGNLVSASSFLRGNLGMEQRAQTPLYSFDEERVSWNSVIRGAVDFNPAQEFYEKYLPQLLNNDVTLINSFIPECPAGEVLLNTRGTAFAEMYLDFYSPLLKCNIEIDGSQHKEKKHNIADEERDKLLNSQGIKVVRIPVYKIADFNAEIRHIASGKGVCKDFVRQAQDRRVLDFNAVIRYQMAVLDLVEAGRLSFADKKWSFNIFQNSCLSENVFEVAVRDLLLYVDNLLVLQGRNKTDIEISVSTGNNFSADSEITVDLDIFKKYDESMTNSDVLYIRNDYFLFDSNAVVVKDGESKYGKFKNYYTVSNGKNCYDLKEITQEKKDALKFFLNVIFKFESFLPKQEEIVFECLRTGSVIGLLPTGAGKSLCYQLSSLLMPGTTIVVSPLQILMRDQYENMVKRHGISNICFINSSSTEMVEMIRGNQVKMCIVSPERFFNAEFLKIIKSEIIELSLIVIDEVHCLSEWGHDFRTSYLCLSHYLRENVDKSCHLIGLTATASPRVCEDVEIEFANFKGYTKIIQSPSLARDNLNVTVKKFDFKGKDYDKSTKYAELVKQYRNSSIEEKSVVFTRTKSTSVFVPNSCYNLVKKIKTDVEGLRNKIDFFSGSADFQDKDALTNEQKLQKYKAGELTTMFATKAFGMGVDIPDIRKTIHYEIPSSIESLYQEFGRAGRDREPAECQIWFYEENENFLSQLFDGDFSIDKIDSLREGFHEINTNLYFLSAGDLDIKKEMFFENFLYKFLFNKSALGVVQFTAEELIFAFKKHVGYRESKVGFCKPVVWVDPKFKEFFNIDFDYKQFIDKALYRLYLLGKISMWGVRYSSNLNNPIYTNIVVLSPTLVDQRRNVVRYINKYDSQYDGNGIKNEDDALRDLLTWSFNHFVYQRLQSIKNIYEACIEYKSPKQFMERIVKYLARDEGARVLLADPQNHMAWFRLLKDISFADLKTIVARYLESDDKLVSLNFISGIVRLLLDDYEDADGERRLKMAFHEIAKFPSEEIQEIMKSMFTIVADNKYRDVLVTSILEVDEKFIDYIYPEYQNEELDSHIVYNFASKLINVGGKVNDRYRKD